MTYTIGVSNLSSDATIGAITVTDVLPTGLTLAGISTTGWSCGAASQTVTCTYPNPLAGGASLPDILLTVTVGAAAVPLVTNTATVATTVPDVVPGNNSASDTTPVVVLAPDLTLSKAAVGPFTIGAHASYELTVSNVGTSATTGAISVTDTLAAGLTFVSAAGPGWRARTRPEPSAARLQGRSPTAHRSR